MQAEFFDRHVYVPGFHVSITGISLIIVIISFIFFRELLNSLHFCRWFFCSDSYILCILQMSHSLHYTWEVNCVIHTFKKAMTSISNVTSALVLGCPKSDGSSKAGSCTQTSRLVLSLATRAWCYRKYRNRVEGDTRAQPQIQKDREKAMKFFYVYNVSRYY